MKYKIFKEFLYFIVLSIIYRHLNLAMLKSAKYENKNDKKLMRSIFTKTKQDFNVYYLKICTAK